MRWIIDYGYVVWQLMLVALAVGGPFLVALIRWMVAARRNSRVRRSLGKPRALEAFDEVEDAVAIQGILRARGLVRRMGGRRAVAATSASLGTATVTRGAEELSIDTAIGRVVIAPPFEIVAGSEESHLGLSASRILVDVSSELRLEAALSHGTRATVRSVAPGDRVVARGRLLRDVAPLQGSLATGDPYRTDASIWLLTGDVDVAFARGPHFVTRARLWKLLAAALLVMPLVLGGMWLVGDAALRRAKKQLAEGQGCLPYCCLQISAPAARIAFAMPFHREKALALLERIDPHHCYTPPGLCCLR